jgi:hypothetical protein
MVITAHIDQWDVVKILIDNGSQVEILFLSTFKKMGHNKELKEPMKPLYGFGGKRIEPVSVITLPASFGTPKTFRHHRYAIPLQCHIRARPTGHFRGRHVFSVPLPQSSCHL